ncbi:NUDIX hydrolase [Paracoccus sp. (in: a-proteobacteria)]|uniref:NUDIX hydrolase n=1 Tax=Paracoccus sp. TaxID=267 RepID=UPI0026E0CEFF|nr:NUDIX hydrolase [Paracoccus sp. (in: a-proteobacteria)]MDO5648437.1 NUDIX hydrolase [Paracoccus sp. (in: a-proteobacteria)]
MDTEEAPFHGAKLLLCHDGALLTYLRDERPDIPFPAHWDLPGGGREGTEDARSCALRELTEEFGLTLPPDRVQGRPFPSHQAPGMVSWLFWGNLTAADIAAIRFGDEGQFWRMMPIADYLAHPRAVPHFQQWIRSVRDATGFWPGTTPPDWLSHSRDPSNINENTRRSLGRQAATSRTTVASTYK